MCEPSHNTITMASAKVCPLSYGTRGHVKPSAVLLCKEFAQKYYQISDTRPDLLYRLYKHNATLSIAETVKGKQKNISVSASNEQVSSIHPRVTVTEMDGWMSDDDDGRKFDCC